MSKTVQLIALVTVPYGTPKKPLEAAPGQEFPCDADEASRLIDRGFARPVERPAAKASAESPTDPATGGQAPGGQTPQQPLV